MPRRELDFGECIGPAYERLVHGGCLLNTVSRDGVGNTMTIAWALMGFFYHDHPLVAVAVKPARYSFELINAVPEYVVSVPTPHLAKAVAYCGRVSGREGEKFSAAGLSPVPSVHVRPPSIAECPMNIECRVYHAERPPHGLLTPEHRQEPVEDQHTIYFAEVLGVYAGGGEA
ncbi:MAG: flavin reductase family protein [Candidatus Brocadiia bacterium]